MTHVEGGPGTECGHVVGRDVCIRMHYTYHSGIEVEYFGGNHGQEGIGGLPHVDRAGMNKTASIGSQVYQCHGCCGRDQRLEANPYAPTASQLACTPIKWLAPLHSFRQAIKCLDQLGVFHDGARGVRAAVLQRSEEHTSELQSRENLVCRLL